MRPFAFETTAKRENGNLYLASALNWRLALGQRIALQDVGRKLYKLTSRMPMALPGNNLSTGIQLPAHADSCALHVAVWETPTAGSLELPRIKVNGGRHTGFCAVLPEQPLP